MGRLSGMGSLSAWNGAAERMDKYLGRMTARIKSSIAAVFSSGFKFFDVWNRFDVDFATRDAAVFRNLVLWWFWRGPNVDYAL